MKLLEVAMRVATLNKGISSVKVDHEIADKVVHRGLRVWGRSGSQALRELTPQQLARATFRPSFGAVRYPGLVEPVELKDVHFLRAEVDAVWAPEHD